MRLFTVRWAVLALSIAGCADRTPARIELRSQLDTIFDDSPRPVNAALVSAKGDVLLSPVLTYSIVPATVADVTPSGTIRCKSSGDASLMVAGGGQNATMSVMCRVVTDIQVPNGVRLVVGHDPEPAHFVPRDAQGNEVVGVPISVSFSAPRIATYDAGKLSAAAPGNVIATVTAGRASAQVPISVVELVRSEPLALGDGESTTMALQQGQYELSIKVKAANGTTNGVTVAWVGTACPDEVEAQEHQSACRVPDAASLTIKNPTAFGLGPAVTGFLNLYRTTR